MLKKSALRILIAPTITLGLILPNVTVAENLIDIFQLSLNNDSGLKAAKFAKQAEEESRPQALAKLFPTIKLSSQAGRASQDIKATWEAARTDESNSGLSIYNQMNLSVALSQPVFNLPHIRSLKLADVKLTQAELNYRIAQQDLLFRVAERYFSVLASNDALNFARAEKNAIARQLTQTKNRFQVGITAVTDVHESQARHDLAVANEIKAETVLANQKETLNRITRTTHHNLMSLKADTPLIPPVPTSMQDWTEAAKGANLQIAEKKLQADILRQEINVVRASNYPTLDFNVDYGYNEFGGAYGQKTLDGFASLDLNMTIFEGNISSTKIKEKKFRFEEMLHIIDAKEREVIQQTRNAYLGVLAGMSYVKALDQALKSSNRALQSITAGFDVGTRTAIEVLDAQRELFRNQRDYTLARYEYVMNMLKLKKAVGLLSIDDLEQINDWLH